MRKMKLTKNQITRILELTKHINAKKQIITMEIADGIIAVSSKNRDMAIKIKNIRTEEKDTDPISFERNFLVKLSKLKADEFDIKTTAKHISSKVGTVKIQSLLLSEDVENEVIEEEVNKNRIIVTKEVMDSLMIATQYIDEKGTRKQFSGVNLKLENSVLHITGTNSFRFYTNQIKVEETTDTFNVILSTETVNALQSVYNISNDKGFPLHVTEKGVYINIKSLYFKSTIIAETFPDVQRILERMEEKEDLGTFEMNEKNIEELKFIDTKSEWLNILRNDKGIVIFKSETETEKNESALKTEEEKEFETNVNYTEFLNAVQRIPKVSIKDRAVLFKNSLGIIILMAKIKDN